MKTLKTQKYLTWYTLIILVMNILLLNGCSMKNQENIVDTSKPKFIVDTKLYPFEAHYLTLSSGTKIHYVDEGKGDILLLLHGNPTWSFLYRKMIDDLKKDFRVIAPDYPGFGLSYASKDFGFTAQEQAREMNEFVKKMNLKGVTIMVQDWGGPIGFNIAIKQPERIKGFIIGNTWAWPLERVGHKAFSTLFGGWIGQYMARSNDGIVSFFMRTGVERELNEKVLAMYHAPFKDKNNRKQTYIFPAQLWDADTFLSNVYKGLKSISDKPALIVWGLEDFAFQEPERTRFESIFVKHKTLLLPKSGHFIQEDAPHKITDAIKNWYPTIK